MNNIPPPPPQSKLFLPIEFWSEILAHLDKKMRVLVQEYGYGETSMTISVYKEKIVGVKFNDEIRVKGLIGKAGVAGAPNAPQGDDSTVSQSPIKNTNPPTT